MCSVEVAEHLATNVLATGLFMVHNALVSGEDDKAELSGGEDLVNDLLEVFEGQIEAGGDDAALVQSAVEVDNDLARALVVDDFELVDVAVLLHDAEELNDDLGDGAEEHLRELEDGNTYLALASFLGVEDVPESIVENGHFHHCCFYYKARVLDPVMAIGLIPYLLSKIK